MSGGGIVRALSFGGRAEQYDRARPSYPPALVDFLTAANPARVLDVGCGTGIAARLFLARGCDVVGVEPDPRMAAVARTHGVTVEESTFEDWDPAGRSFDLLTAGQAWHWVNPEVALPKAAAVLRPGGRLALFWNRSGPEPRAAAMFAEVYGRLAPEIWQDSVVLGTSRAGTELQVAGGSFGPLSAHRYVWHRRHTGDEWLDQAATHSDHALLPEGRRAELLAAVGEAIARLGGSLFVHYETHLLTAVVA